MDQPVEDKPPEGAPFTTSLLVTKLNWIVLASLCMKYPSFLIASPTNRSNFGTHHCLPCCPARLAAIAAVPGQRTSHTSKHADEHRLRRVQRGLPGALSVAAHRSSRA